MHDQCMPMSKSVEGNLYTNSRSFTSHFTTSINAMLFNLKDKLLLGSCYWEFAENNFLGNHFKLDTVSTNN